MVGACALHFDEFEIDIQKESIPDVFIYLFQECDRRSFLTQDGDEGQGYFASRTVVLDRLNLAGYTAEKTEQVFSDWLNETREEHASYGKWAEGIYNALIGLNYEEWKFRVGEILKNNRRYFIRDDEYRDDLHRAMNNLSSEYLFFASEYLISLRALLEAMPDVKEVWLDITPLIEGGWIEPDDPICDTRRHPKSFPKSKLEPFVIITEGSTDVLILRRSLGILYPHLFDYVSFFDYEISNSDAGANWVVKFLKAFMAARISTLILAVFDNDAAGNDALKTAFGLNLPDNIKIMHLPDIELGRAYPTIGPQGKHLVDINGSAVSIELFTGRHNLVGSDGRLIPIVWGNYMKSVERYQGSLQEKSAPISRFIKETEQHNDSLEYRDIYPELCSLWENIFKIVQEARSPV